MATFVDKIAKHLDRGKLEDALDVAIEAWREQRAIAIAELVDAIDATDPTPAFDASNSKWLAAARKAEGPRERGALLRAILQRPSGDLSPAMRIAAKWEDPRLSTQIIALLAALPFSGKRTRDVWRDVFAIARDQRDPRFLVLARNLPGTWNVGADTKKYLNNRLAEANEGLDDVVLAPELEAAVRALAAKVKPVAAAQPKNETSLLDAIYANPDDDGPRLVYADWLQERGDPRGELIAMQLQPAHDDKHVRALVKTHRKAWLGVLAPALAAEVEFRRGFPVAGIVKFRNQRDVEQHGQHAAWATFESLKWTASTARDDQVEWARCITPAMWNVRHVDGAHPRSLLAAARPWRIESMVVPYDLELADFRALCESALFPRLASLEMGGYGRVEWLDGLGRSPPELRVRTSIDDARAWLERAQGIPTLQTFTIDYWIMSYKFSRDANGKLTRLAIEIRPNDPVAAIDKFQKAIDEVGKQVEAMPDGSLTHFAAVFELHGKELVPLPKLDAIGATKLR